MSGDDASNEMTNNSNFDSPNISTSEEIEQERVEETITEEQRIQKERETVHLDGIPIEAEQIQFRSADISKRDKMNYFVNIEGADKKPAPAAAPVATPVATPMNDAQTIQDTLAQPQQPSAEKSASTQMVEEKLNEAKQWVQNALHTQSAKMNGKIDFGAFFAKNKKTIIGAGVAIVVVIVAIFVVIPQLGRKKHEPIVQEEFVDVDYSTVVIPDPYDSAIFNLDNGTDFTTAVKDGNFERIDQIYTDFESNISEPEEAGLLYADKAIRLLRYAPDQHDRIIEASDKALTLAPDSLKVNNRLVYIYKYFNETEKAQKVSDKIEELSKEKPAEDANSGE